MTEHLQISGAHVATVTVPPSSYLSRHTPATTLHVFHDPSAWSVLAVPLPEPDEPRQGSEVRLGRFENLAELLDDLHSRWPLQSVVDAVLDAGHDRYEPDPDLHAVWLVSRIDRDFDGASVCNQDLAEGGHFGDPVPAVGRQLPDWHLEALDAMAAHLIGHGFRILARTPGDLERREPFGNPILGTLTVVRYGHTIAGTVRVDAAGELFIRANWLERDDEDRGPGTDLAIRARQLRPEPA